MMLLTSLLELIVWPFFEKQLLLPLTTNSARGQKRVKNAHLEIKYLFFINKGQNYALQPSESILTLFLYFVS